MKLTTKNLDSKINNLNKDQKLMLYVGLFIFIITKIYQLGLAVGKFYYYIAH